MRGGQFFFLGLLAGAAGGISDKLSTLSITLALIIGILCVDAICDAVRGRP